MQKLTKEQYYQLAIEALSERIDQIIKQREATRKHRREKNVQKTRKKR